MGRPARDRGRAQVAGLRDGQGVLGAQLKVGDVKAPAFDDVVVAASVNLDGNAVPDDVGEFAHDGLSLGLVSVTQEHCPSARPGAQSLRVANLAEYAFECLHQILAVVGEARIGRRAVAGMGVDRRNST